MSKTAKLSWLPIALVLFHLGLLVSFKFTAWPEMTLWPYLMTEGWMPYRNIAIAHTPLMLLDLGISYKVFGTGILQLKMFTWILILLMDGFVYWVVKRFLSNKTALGALFFFILFQVFYDGNGLWFDLYMGVLAFVSFYFIQKKDFFWAGIFWALAFISKQTAVWFLVPIGLQSVRDAKSAMSNLKKFSFGVLWVLAPFVLVLRSFGILTDFYNWAVNFGIFLLPKAQGQVHLPALRSLAVSAFPFTIFIPLIWKTGARNIHLLFWAVAGSLGAYPRFEYFHFQPALPYLAISAALVFSGAVKKDRITKMFVFLYVLGSLYLFANFFMRNYREGTRFYGRDVQKIVSYIRANAKPGEKIFVMNWWDNLYALSDTLPATDPWVPQLLWYTEMPGLQEKMIGDLENSKPKMIVLNQYSEVGLSAYVPQKVYNYVTQNYKLKEKIDGISILVPNK